MPGIRSALASWLYRPTRQVDVAIDGLDPLRFALHRRKDIWISDSIARGHVFERQILDLMRHFLAPGGFLLDIGANIGWFSVIGSRLVGAAGIVVAVEPDPYNLRLLRSNLRLNGCVNVEVISVAAGAEHRNATLYRSGDNQGDHQLAVGSNRADRVNVQVRTIDALLTGRKQAASFVKIDTQGSETAILRGMGATLMRMERPRMVLEYWPFGLVECGSSVESLAAVLQETNLALWLIFEDGATRRTSPGQLIALGQSEYAPSTERHADIVAVSRADAEAVAFLTGKEQG